MNSSPLNVHTVSVSGGFGLGSRKHINATTGSEIYATGHRDSLLTRSENISDMCLQPQNQ